jgi:hypothetical protein
VCDHVELGHGAESKSFQRRTERLVLQREMAIGGELGVMVCL